ncbi:MAG: hypothetical protein ACR5LD_07025 [Symbiopectobacterium sp.]
MSMPRFQATWHSLAAQAVTSGGDSQLSYAQGVHMGHDLRSLNI